MIKEYLNYGKEELGIKPGVIATADNKDEMSEFFLKNYQKKVDGDSITKISNFI